MAFGVIALNISVIWITTENVEECIIGVIVVGEEIASVVPRLCVTRVLPVFGVEAIHCHDDLRHVILCLSASCLVLNTCKGREKQRHQDRDDRDHDE